MPPSCCAGKAPRVAASLASLLGTMHALPLAYSKDLQEDKEPLFDAIDNLELCLAAAARMLAGSASTASALAAARDEMLAATDIADVLVARGVPFREAHGVVAGLVRTALESGKAALELDDSELDGVPEGARQAVRGRCEARAHDRVEGLRRRHLLGAAWRSSSIEARERPRRGTPRVGRSTAVLRPLGARGGPRADRLHRSRSGAPPG